MSSSAEIDPGTPRTAHLDCPSGVSGDMWLGALVDAGASLERIQDAVDQLGVGDVRISWGRVRRAGEPAVSVRVRPPQETASPGTWRAVRDIIEDAGLAAAVRDRAHAVFRRLAEADAEISGVPVEEVRFPELGALDQLGDVVATCAAVADLGLTRLTIGPIASGTPTIETLHGTAPNPDPTVRVLLRGHRLVQTDVAAELVTPTGAALVAELAQPVEEPPRLAVERTGTGAGAADLAQPNVLRLLIGRSAGS